ncbi:phage terminase large subunit [Acinetobacter radioresistens]|uniref:phage terminase large subunit n=1 Tax=Acinetobacter radioresistens TaxID=40216 RepID=UPI0039846704
MTDPKISFLAFFLLWASHQGWKVPDFHILVCTFLEGFYLRGRTGLLMLPRGHSKSSILDVFNAWVIYCWPETLILHQGTTDDDAYKCSNGTKNVLENHPLCIENPDMKRKKGETERWWVQGSSDIRYGTMLSKGILSGVTGHRAHFIQNDDVETPKTTGTPDAREKLRFRLSEQTHIALPKAKKLWIGTPHSHDSLYDDIKKYKNVSTLVLKMFEHEKRIEDAKSGQVYLLDFEPIHAFAGIGKGSKYLVKGKDYLCNQQGSLYKVVLIEDHYVADFYSEGIWSERFDSEEMTSRREECKTLNEWDSQYQMHAKPVGNVRLDPDKMIPYDCEPVLRRANGSYIMMLGGRQIVGMTMRWDPSSGKTKSDISNVALVLHDDFGTKYWHRSLALTGEVSEHDGQGNIVGGQVWQLCDLIEEFNVPRITIETNGPGTFAPSALKGALKKRRIRCGVAEVHNSIAKNKRILEALEGPLLSGLLWVHTSVVDTPEEGENSSPTYKKMRMFNPAITNQPDDELDSLAGAITDSPERVGKIHNGLEPNESPNWRTDGGVTDAALDFEEY